MDMSLSKLQETLRTGKPGVLQSMWLQRVRLDIATEQQRLHYIYIMCIYMYVYTHIYNKY